MSRPRHPVRALAAALLAGAATPGVMPLPPAADAHPFGEPQTARLSAEGATVTIRWTAAPDDLVLLGGAVGALPNRQTIVFDTGPEADPKPVGESAAELLTSSPDVAAYLESHLSVRQDGTPCPADVALDELIDEGALISFSCPRDIREVDIQITSMTDLHKAYRTVALADGSIPDQALYTAQDTVHSWSFHSDASPGTPVPWTTVTLAATIGVTVALGLRFWHRRRPRRDP